MESTTITLTGNSSNLSANIFPEIQLDPTCNYSCGLLDFTTYNSIPNVVKNCNNVLDISFDNGVKPPQLKCFILELGQGAYEIQDIIDCILKKANGINEIKLEMILNKNTCKVTFKCNAVLQNLSNSILPTLGFHKATYEANEWHKSEKIVNVTDLAVIRIECDIVRGAYINGVPTHTIHQFSPKVAPGFKIVEAPINIIYLPIAVKSIESVHLSIVDQDGRPINFQEETIICRVHIKKIP